MRVNKCFCDHCGKELEAMHDYEDVDISVDRPLMNTDLCVECFDELCKQIERFCKAHNDERAEKRKEQK